jgi:hypothetical protein
MPSEKTHHRNQSVVRLFKAGLPLEEIAKSIKCTPTYTLKIIRENDPDYKPKKRAFGLRYNTNTQPSPLNPRVKNPDAMWEQAYKEGRL